jgi:hypothetical protein
MCTNTLLPVVDLSLQQDMYPEGAVARPGGRQQP